MTLAERRAAAAARKAATPAAGASPGPSSPVEAPAPAGVDPSRCPRCGERTVVATDVAGSTWRLDPAPLRIVTWASLNAAGVGDVHARTPGLVAVVGLAGRSVVGGIVLPDHVEPTVPRTNVRRSHQQRCPVTRG